MATTHVYDSIRSFLATQFSGVYQVVDWDHIDPVLAQGNDPFIALEEAPASEEMVGFGDQSSICHREDGGLIVHAFTPAPESSNSARQIAENIMDALRLQIIQGVEIVNVGPPNIETLNDGLWSSGSSAISYRYDSHHARP